MFEYRAIWNVQGGGTGYSVFHVREGVTPSLATAAQGFADDLRAGFALLTGILPDDVIINFDSEARQLNSSTGVLEAVAAVNPPAQVAGTSASSYSAPAGGRVDLITESIVNGRRLRGRTYIVPLVSTAYSTTGTLTASARTSLENAFETFRDETDLYSLGVWHRPVGGAGGIIADVASVSAPAESAILRSRRE
jgi:hypothetical protein